MFLKGNSFGHRGVSPKWIRNSMNSGNLINHWGMNWTQFKDTQYYPCVAGNVLASWPVTQEVAGSNNPFIILYFLSLNLLNLVKRIKTRMHSSRIRTAPFATHPLPPFHRTPCPQPLSCPSTCWDISLPWSLVGTVQLRPVKSSILPILQLVLLRAVKTAKSQLRELYNVHLNLSLSLALQCD